MSVHVGVRVYIDTRYFFGELPHANSPVRKTGAIAKSYMVAVGLYTLLLLLLLQRVVLCLLCCF